MLALIKERIARMKGNFLLLVLMTIATSASAQTVFELSKEEQRANDLRARFFLSTSMGPVSPSNVNQFIDQYIENSLGPSYISFGSSDITAVGMVGLGVAIPLNKTVHTRIFLEYAGASKTVRLNSDTERFAVNRFAPGVLLDYYFYSSGFGSVYVEGGAYYGFTSFRNVSANGPGFKFNLGYAWHRPQTTWDIFIGVDLPSTRAEQNFYELKKIDLTAPLFGFRINF
jgi:hypothetical protein